MTKILVTGGAGFIGSHTCQALLKQGDDVVIVDNFNDYYNPEQKEKNVAPLIRGGAVLERLDIRNAEAIKKLVLRENVEKIVHLAAMAGVRTSMEQPALYEDVNMQGTLNLLEAAKDGAVSQFVFASTSSVYGNSRNVPFSEDQDTDRPESLYGATKKAGELYAYIYHNLYNLRTTCLRFFTVYGPAGRPDMAPWLFTEAIDSGRPLKRFGDGSSQRDYTYIDDIVSGILGALDNPLDYEIINLGNNQTVSLNDFIATIERLLGKEAIIEDHPMPPGDVFITYANIDKAKKLLNYNPQTNIEEGLKNFIEWYRENR